MSKHVSLPHVVTLSSENAKWRKEIEGTRLWMSDNEEEHSDFIYIYMEQIEQICFI